MTDGLVTRPDSIPGGIEVLKPSDVPNVRIPWDARYSLSDVAEFADERPGLSLWNRRTGGFLLGGKWRHRDEIANVVDIIGPSIASELLVAFVQRAEEFEFELAIVAEYAERRQESFYSAAGLEPIEDIVVYELGRLPDTLKFTLVEPSLVVEVVDVGKPQQRELLLNLDHAAFPWLWWNSAGEFENYASAPGVEIVLVRRDDNVAVGYIGTTSLGSWGHLDRIAVAPAFQGQGLGRRLLELSIARLRSKGARRMALSTQASNTVSRSLYESVGFRRSRSHDYRIYGRWIGGASTERDEKLGK